ncbi:PREDICTED: uncharacterized protein LOC107063623 [Polistes dominula]|uniref:Uncharacterized protein LOC107063623 n=1 Tax=Polistes dominula TaxID=743375 RepID=A0ABM1HST0_POLDO|nr:PREDICTED: uncharacterized protein LOC107063623 [Polistes dominula]
MIYLSLFIIVTFYVSSFSVVNTQSPNCITPNGIAANCISIHQCTPLLKKLEEKPLRQETIDYLKGSQCGFDGLDPLVCCPPNINSSNPNLNKPLEISTETSISTLENVNNNDAIIKLLDNPLLPSDCGRDSIPRDLETVETSPSEFPWMVLLEYNNGLNRKVFCTGSLITKRYVLTAAHCLSNTTIGKLLYVRLGVYNLTSAQNCVKRDGIEICSDGSIRVGVEETMKHDLFILSRQFIEYDVALVRLSKDIVSTNYIKPICLPRSSMIKKRLYAAGWGATSTSNSSNVKLKVSLPLFDKENCKKLYKSQLNITLTFEHICTGGEGGRNTCRGDSGGPLMAYQDLPNGDKIWTAVGVVSFGPRYCAIAGWPTVSVNVYNLIPWIISKIKPICGKLKTLVVTECIVCFSLLKKYQIKSMYVLFTAVATFYISSFSIVDAQYPDSPNCTTPNGIAGNCISIHQCTPLLKKLEEKPLRQETIDYLKGSQCGFDGLVPLVCCPPNIDSSNANLNKPLEISTETSISTLQNVNINDAIIKLLDNPLLPSDCGKDSTPRDLESATTTLGEFPWLVLLEYNNGNISDFKALGALISKRYVLTAAHCLIERPLWKLSRVRLGVHDLRSSTNCVNGDDGNICSDGSISVEVEETLKHELYELYTKINKNYDIGLVRLSKDIVSTYYVKPICLPRSSVIDKRLYAAGWGRTLTSLSSNVKLKVSLPLVDKDTCERIYRSNSHLNLSFEQICAGGEKDRDACYGDSGGPLMGFRYLPNGDKIWTAEGIVSFGNKHCGSVGWPTVYTKVYDFIPWIISKIRP